MNEISPLTGDEWNELLELSVSLPERARQLLDRANTWRLWKHPPTRFVEGKDTALRPWEVSIGSASKVGQARIMRALIATRGYFTDCHMGRSFMVWIPDGRLRVFCENANPWEVRFTSRVQVGRYGYQCNWVGCELKCPPGHHGGSEWQVLDKIFPKDEESGDNEEEGA